jgi:hypothetical protein
MVMPLSYIESFKAQAAAGEKCSNKSTTESSNVTTGTGDFQGSSNATGPIFNGSHKNIEPEGLVPNPLAFDLAKNESNSENPPDSLINSLKNKTVIEPNFNSSSE